MRFCQADGTPLVDDAPAPDPYKTMVASPGEFASAMGGVEPAQKVDDEVLQLPENDPRKTMYASEDEIRQAMDANDEPVIDLPPLEPEPPRFSEPSLSPPSFGDVAPAPPSPFAPSSNEPIANPASESPFSKTTPPIPSPFDNPKPSTYAAPEEFRTSQEPERPFERVSSPFDQPHSAPIEPAVSAGNWNPAEPAMGEAAGAGAGQNKTLAIISLALSIISIPCCGFVVIGLAGAIAGFIAKGKADSNPALYGGRSLALTAIIIGAVTTIIGILTNSLALLGLIPIPQFP